MTTQNKLDRMKYLKSLAQMTSNIHRHASLYLHAQTSIDTLLY